ncbi:fibrinogen-like YCDxxxxGGGW domain-containing protein [Arthrobacter psychrochitiniphilus]|uniref:fibrinogen-like YCDxxxxGGGW domain-containing protein n=1 Tax=Arthrobacter psychrochitiniphilus TaxID=291045 RepID=UPI003F7B9EF9
MKSTNGQPNRSLLRTAAGLLTAAVVPLSLLFAFTPSAQAAGIVYDGSSPEQAAASCWEVKTLAPSAPTGVYWLRTPELPVPTQFYCDQTTDGGGWVLIGRGRQGWKENYEGYGTTAQVSANVTGTPAFVPRQLASTVVDGLLNGARPDSLTDGVRLVRATDTAGTAFQEVRYKYTKQERWVWTFRSETPVGSFTIGGANGSGGQTGNFGTDQNQRRVYMQTAVSQNWTIGFSYGSNARGSSDPGSYIWSASAAAGNPKPFTQMFLRPKLLQSNFANTTIADIGSAAFAQAPLANTGAMSTVWGVSGLANGSTSEMSTEVQAFTESSGTVFAGGNFKYVQQSKAGVGQVEQPYLAGFNVNSGAWMSGFRPTFNGQIKALVTLPNGLIVVGGEFTQANGQPHGGVVVLNPTDGTTNNSVTVDVRNALSGGVLQVRSLKVEGNWLYIGGNFTHLGGGTHPATTIYSRSAARVSITTGTPDATWNPAFNGTVSEVEPSTDGSRLYAAGYFTSTNSVAANKIAALQTTAGAAKVSPDWTMISSGGADFQFTVSEAASRIWHGGSEHDLFSYSKDDFTRLSTHIGKYNGDFQTSEINNGTLYAGCHCNDFIYTGASFWPNLGTNWSVADKLGFVGAWNAETGVIEQEFNPILDTRAGHGAWGTFSDSNGNLWIGGDFSNSVTVNTASQWSGGFVRFAPRDTLSPPAPSNLTVTSNGLNDTLAWQASSESGVRYQVLRNDRVIGTASGTSFSTVADPGAKYFVRAADNAGNYSASTAKATAPVVANPPEVLVPKDATWSYRFENSAPDPQWRSNGYDDSAWSAGAAPLGWGSSSLATALTAVGTKPVAVQYRKTFTVAQASNVASLELSTWADDGLVVYVNGVEAGRTNMPAGTISFNSYATAAPRSTSVTAVTFTVPGSVLVTGVNTVTAQVNSNYRSTPDSSFDLSVLATAGTQPPQEPQPQVLIPAAATWKYNFENAAPDPAWFSTTYDDGTWQSGQAPLGWGHSSISTVLSVPGTKPLAAQYRYAFQVADPAVIASVTVTTRADDGLVLYMNGNEVGRYNLPMGPISYNTYATASPRTANAISSPITLELPPSAFTVGTNILSAAVHSNYRTTPDTSFALTASTVPLQNP